MSQITIAYETLKLMDRCVRVDQGNKYRENLGKVLPHITDAYRSDEDGLRGHLGASQVGHDCARAVWYDFHWTTKSSFSGQMLRLFNRGHLEEGRFIALLLTMGCQIYQQDENGKQFKIQHADGHFGGSSDGVVIGLPDLYQGMPALGEFKTHNKKSFESLAGDNWRKHLDYYLGYSTKPTPFNGDGVKESKPEHYTQMQIYMRKMGLAVTLYVAVNKDTDDIYCEFVPLDVTHAELFLDRGEKIIDADQPPKKMSESPGFWKCRFCDHHPVCHLNKPPEHNCRTCAFSSPVRGEPGGKWVCRMREIQIDRQLQQVGCEHYSAKKGL